MRRVINSIIIIAVMTLCLVFFTGCSMVSSATPTPTEDANATPVPAKITDANYIKEDRDRFSIEYNSNWIIKDPLEKDESSAIIITVPADSEKSSEGKILPFINVIYAKITDVETFNLEEETKSNIEYLKNNISNFAFFSVEGESEYKQTELGGENAYVFEYAGTLSNANEARFKQIITAKNGYMFTITYVASYDYYIDKDYKDIVDKTINSFNFK